MEKIRLDIGGPKGNAFYILGLVKGLAEDKEIANEIRTKMMGADYNWLLKIFKEHFPFVELYSHSKLNSVDEDLYVVSNDVVEL
jgi:hypothetical protein